MVSCIVLFEIRLSVETANVDFLVGNPFLTFSLMRRMHILCTGWKSNIRSDLKAFEMKAFGSGVFGHFPNFLLAIAAINRFPIADVFYPF